MVLFTRFVAYVFILFSGVFFCFQSVSAATIYANSITGNDTTGDGSLVSPYKTFHKSYTEAVNGDTINLDGIFDWENEDETGDVATNGYVVNKDLIITGQSAEETIVQAGSEEGMANRSVFYISSGRNVTLKKLTIRHGVITNNGSRAGGVSNFGILTVTSSIITANQYNSTEFYGAGGIYSHENTDVFVYDSLIATNTFNGNYYGSGGLFGSQNVDILISRSTFFNNQSNSLNPNSFPFSYAQPSGAIGSFRFGTLEITNSTITDNHTNSYAGAVQIYYKWDAILTNNTIVSNTAQFGAGGVMYESAADGADLFLSNNIIANNLANGVENDFYTVAASAGRVQDNGYNIIEFSTNKVFNAPGNITGNQVNLNLSPNLENNFTNRYTPTLALLPNSVAINAGTTTANDIVAIPLHDQRGGGRNGATDIGAYEYSAAGIISSYTFNYVAGDNGSILGNTVQIVNSADSGTEVTAVPDEGYTFIGWSDNVLDNPRTDINASEDINVTALFADQTAPVISNNSVSVNNNSATINWNTNELASSKVTYGPSDSLGNSTVEFNTNPRVLEHSVILNNLVSCATYYYFVSSIDSSDNLASSTVGNFSTQGCSGESAVSNFSITRVATSTPLDLNLQTEGKGIVVSVPEGYSSTTASFQIKKLEKSTVLGAIGKPAGFSEVGDHTYNLNAITNSSTRITSFDKPLTITISYDDSDVLGIKEDSLKIYRWDGVAWYELSNCVVNKNANTVTCSTGGFSVFALFGNTVSGSGMIIHIKPEVKLNIKENKNTVEFLTKNVTHVAVSDTLNFEKSSWKAITGNSYNFVSKDKGTVWYFKFRSPTGAESTLYTVDLSVKDIINDKDNYPINDNVKTKKECVQLFNEDIKEGERGKMVKELQVYLNNLNFILANSGAGAPGNETLYFGSLTKKALISFQKSKQLDQTGVLDSNTRALICKPEKAVLEQNISGNKLFTRNLSFGMTGEDVRLLQKRLNKEGFLVSEQGLGSPGQETNGFYSKTQDALQRFQRANGLPAYGFFGNLTRNLLN